MNRKIITILLICIFLVQGTKSVATENNKGVMSREINGVLYVYSEVDDNSVCIYRILPLYGKPLSNIVIPSRIDEKDVVGLGCQDSFDDEYYINHVGMYIGNGEIINASNPRSGIKISKIGYRGVVAIRNVID